MGVFRVKKNSNYTVMSNNHFKERKMSLKAKGLLSVMLSLPDNWDYTINGLVAINKENITSIRSALKELQEFGYLEIIKTRKDGRIDWDYNIHEQPIQPIQNKQNNDINNVQLLQQENQRIESLYIESLPIENPLQVNTKQVNTKQVNTNTLKSTPENILVNPKKKTNTFNLKEVEQMKALIFSTFKNIKVQDKLLEYFKQRRPKRLQFNQWQIILNDLVVYCNNDKERLLEIDNSIAGGYMVIIPAWKKTNNKKSNTLGNISRTSKTEDKGKSLNDMSENEKTKWKDENFVKDKEGNFLKY